MHFSAQGLREKVYPIPGPAYVTIGSFMYWSESRSEAEIMDIFNHLRFREDD